MPLNVSTWSDLLLAFCVLVAPLAAEADDDTFKAPATAPSITAPKQHADHSAGRWQGDLTASLSFTSGNSDTTATLLNADLARRLSHSKTALESYFNFSTSRVGGVRQTATQKWGAAIQQDRDLSGDWFAFGKFGLDGDRTLSLTQRTVASVGAGYHLLDEDEHNVEVFGGLSYTDRLYSAEQNIDERQSRHFLQPGGLIGEESHHKFNEQVSFKQRLEVYPDFSASQAHTAKFNGTMQVTMTRTLSLSVSLVSSYNRRVTAGLHTTDTTFFTGLNLKLD
jgi:putative salt-induced outer membrane protein